MPSGPERFVMDTMTTDNFSPDSDVLIVEDLMLLLLDDQKGTAAGAQALEYVLGGGLLVELALRERAEQEDKKSFLTGRKILAIGSGPLPDPLLQDAYDTIAEKPRGAQSVLGKIGKGLPKAVSARLVERGMVREEKSHVLGIVPRTLHPAADKARETAVRQKVRAVLADRTTPDPRTASLIALLSAGGVLKASLKDMDPPLKWSSEIKKRGKEIQDGDWGASAVSDAVKAMAASMAAVVAASAASASAAPAAG
jgi:hypothetical protein